MEGEPRLPVTLSAQRYYLVHIHLPRRVNFPGSHRDFPVKADYFVTLFYNGQFSSHSTIKQIFQMRGSISVEFTPGLVDLYGTQAVQQSKSSRTAAGLGLNLPLDQV